MLLVVGVIAVVGVGVFAWAKRDTSATGSGGDQQKGGTTTVIIQQQGPTQPPSTLPGPSGSSPPKGGDNPLGNLGLLGAAGAVGAIVGGQAAFTNVGKAAAVPVGLGVAGAAYLATSVGGAAAAGGLTGIAAAGVWAIPVFLITTSIIALIDNITRAVQTDQWKKLCATVASERAAGRFREAQEIYARAKAEISEIAQVWPQPHEDWYNRADPLGRPFPGFPGPPSPASAADVAANPSLVPTYLDTTDGKRCNVREFLAAVENDVRDVRAVGLAPVGVPVACSGGRVFPGQGAPGEVPGGTATRTDLTGKVIAATGVTVVTAGPRSLANWPELKQRLDALSTVRSSIAQAVPWIALDAVPNVTGLVVYTPEDLAAFAAKSAASRAEEQRREGVTVKRQAAAVGGGVVNQRTIAAAAEAKAEGQAAATEARTESAQGRTQSAAERNAGGAGEAGGVGDRAAGNQPRQTGGRNA